MGKTTGQRFASVWDALPPGLRDSMPLQSDAELEAALLDATSALARKQGFSLVHGPTGYRLAGHGRLLHVGQLIDAAKALHRFTKTTQGPLAGAGCATALDSAGNALQSVWLALPIATNDWTDATENATRPRDTEGARLSNEKS